MGIGALIPREVHGHPDDAIAVVSHSPCISSIIEWFFSSHLDDALAHCAVINVVDVKRSDPFVKFSLVVKKNKAARNDW